MILDRRTQCCSPMSFPATAWRASTDPRNCASTYISCQEMILKSDREAALRSVQEEVKSRREARTNVDNSGVGDSQADGAAETAVQALGE